MFSTICTFQRNAADYGRAASMDAVSYEGRPRETNVVEVVGFPALSTAQAQGKADAWALSWLRSILIPIFKV